MALSSLWQNFGNQRVQALASFQQNAAGLGQQNSNLLQQYGFTSPSSKGQFSADPNAAPATGAYGDLQLDTSNPFGAYQQQIGQSAATIIAAKRRYAATGIRGGLANQAGAQATTAANAGLQNTRTQITQALSGLTSQANNNRTNYANQLGGISGNEGAYNADQGQLDAQATANIAAQQALQAQIAQQNALLAGFNNPNPLAPAPQQGGYLPTSTVAQAAAHSTKSVVGKVGNSGVHAM